MDIFHAIILAIIAGVTQFLPVSSSGHLLMASQLMQMPHPDFVKTFEIALQLGAMFAVIGLYWRTFLLDWEVDLRMLAAFVPSAIIGLLLYKMIKHTLLGNPWVVVWSWFLGGAFIIFWERFYPTQGNITTMKKISFPQAMLIGMAQALGVIPGVSAAAATIIGGLILGIERKTIIEFSFILAVPTLMAMSIFGIIKADGDLTADQWGVLGLGFLIAFIAAWGAMKFLLHYVERHRLTAFGIYRVLAALAAGAYLNLLLS